MSFEAQKRSTLPLSFPSAYSVPTCWLPLKYVCFSKGRDLGVHSTQKYRTGRIIFFGVTCALIRNKLLHMRPGRDGAAQAGFLPSILGCEPAWVVVPLAVFAQVLLDVASRAPCLAPIPRCLLRAREQSRQSRKGSCVRLALSMAQVDRLALQCAGHVAGYGCRNLMDGLCMSLVTFLVTFW